MTWAAANAPLCPGSFSFFPMVLMPKYSLIPTWRQSFDSLFSLMVLASVRPGTAILPQICVTHTAMSSSFLPLTSSDPSCTSPGQIKQGWVVLKHLCACHVPSTVPHTGWQRWTRHTQTCTLEAYDLVQIVFKLVQLSLYFPDQTTKPSFTPTDP